jgi:hypothetical protein
MNDSYSVVHKMKSWRQCQESDFSFTPSEQDCLSGSQRFSSESNYSNATFQKKSEEMGVRPSKIIVENTIDNDVDNSTAPARKATVPTKLHRWRLSKVCCISQTSFDSIITIDIDTRITTTKPRGSGPFLECQRRTKTHKTPTTLSR